MGDIMTRKILSVRPNTSLLVCTKEFVRNNVNHLLVAEGDVLKGLLAQRDILWTITKKPNIDLSKVRAIDVATRKVAVIKPSADISQAFQKMKRYGFRRLPVLSKGKIVGILTLNDILKMEPMLYSQAGDLLQIREEAEKLKNVREEKGVEGLCDECGAFAELLKVDKRFLCPDCRDELY